jgi:hypothetical protein
MASKSKNKGSYHERWFLKLFESLGLKIKKQPLSGSLGGEYRADLLLNLQDKDLFVEVKYRDKSTFPNVFNLLEDRDLALCKRKIGDPRYCVIIKDKVFEDIIAPLIIKAQHYDVLMNTSVIKEKAND